MYVVDANGRKKGHVVGLAPVSGMCNSLNSCTISEGTSFQTVLVAAHEMGHRSDKGCIIHETFLLLHFPSLVLRSRVVWAWNTTVHRTGMRVMPTTL